MLNGKMEPKCRSNAEVVELNAEINPLNSEISLPCNIANRLQYSIFCMFDETIQCIMNGE